jgi:hypothetical protein
MMGDALSSRLRRRPRSATSQGDTLDPEIVELENSIQEAAAILHASNETHWENWLRVNLQLIQNREIRGIEGMLGAYGGMGSINDLYVNDRLESLLNRIYDLCDKLRRQSDVPRGN